MMNINRILVLSENISATQHIGFSRPLKNLVIDSSLVVGMGSIHKVRNFKAKSKKLWEQHNPDVLILSRFTNARALHFIEVAKKTGIPVIFHIDDDLLNVPLSLGKEKYDAYHQPKRMRALVKNMNASDLIYVSTKPLAIAFEKHGITRPIVAGDLYCSIDADLITTPLPSTVPVIGYMGTGGHSADLAMMMPAIVKLMNENPLLRFETFGTIKPPKELSIFGNRYAHHKGVSDYELFLERLKELGWWVGIAPLEDNPFNRCKADTKWVEYSFAGMPVVASDLPVYHKACADESGILAKNNTEWFYALKALVRDAALRQKFVTNAQTKLSQQYTHNILEKQIMGVIQQVQSTQRNKAENVS